MITNPTSQFLQAFASRCSHLCLCLLIVNLASGCRLAKSTVEIPGRVVSNVTPGQKSKQEVDPVIVQQAVLRFADQFSTRMILGAESLSEGDHALQAARVLRWKIALVSSANSIASGPNAVVSLLDMTVFVTATRIAFEEYWQPQVFGDTGLVMLDACRSSEEAIWELVGAVLHQEQQTELRRAIADWARLTSRPEDMLAARAPGLASQMASVIKADPAKSGSVFSMLMIDPLSSLDPATREIAQTRLFAERALFVAQKMPLLLRWQTELLSLNAVDMPAVRQMVTNSTQIAASVDRFAAVAEELPDLISGEREEILNALEEQEKEAASLLSAATEMSTSLNTTLTTFDALMKRFGVGEPSTNSRPATNSHPFNILEYAETAERMTLMAKELDLLINGLGNGLDSPVFDKRLKDFDAAAAQVADRATGVVNHAFLLIAGVVILIMVCGLIYRWFGSRPSVS